MDRPISMDIFVYHRPFKIMTNGGHASVRELGSVGVFSFYARQQLILSVCPSVRPSVTRVDQSKAVQARIRKFSPSAARKTLVSRSVKLFHQFKRGNHERGRTVVGRDCAAAVATSQNRSADITGQITPPRSDDDSAFDGGASRCYIKMFPS